ncbi:MAG: orotidine-5'-phosphate decarboxylase [Bacilli bacterium]|jgi:orotidine-5'-phosphate decarboxylase|nr:orotidine-5'-phosphate decarboxylase [Bacilli bacterium]
MNKDVIIALDFKNKDEALNFLKQFKSSVYVKIGMELYYSEGPNIIKEIKALNHKIFLDLKLHDIPNTVASAMRVLKNLDVDIVNVHCAGGIKMMKAAKEVFKDTNTKVIAVTQLTSTSQEMLTNELLIKEDINDVIVNYARLAYEAGLDGVVCSPLEAKIIHNNINKDFLTICPGIRYESGKDDQVRITTPSKAKELTCDYIVVGRPITKANDSLAMYKQIKKEFI